MKYLLSVLSLMLSLSVFGQAKMTCCDPKSGMHETKNTPDGSATSQFAMLSNDPAFVKKHDNPEPLKFESETGKWISIKSADGKDAKVYEVKSAKPTKNYILMVHEWWGLNDYIKREAENLQKELGNVTVLAIDLYDGQVATTQEDAGKYMQSVTTDRAKAIINAAVSYAGKDAKIATIGWCFGGGWSLQSTLLAGKQGVACIMYYGMPESDVEKLKTLNPKVLAFFGKQDKWINPDVVAKFEVNMKAAGKSLTVKSYDTDHAFANPSNPHYDKAATEDSHKLSVAFLKSSFGI